MINDYDISNSEEFLTLLDESADKFTFQTFDDNKARSDGSLAHVLNGSIEEVNDRLIALNRRGAGVFVTPNLTDLKGRKKENITGIRCVFQELDNGVIKDDPIEPHIIVKSSEGKQHKYWLCNDLSFEEYDGVLDRMVLDYGSDNGAKGANRVLRLPGFYHMKDPDNPQMVEIIHESGGLNYTKDQILESFPPVIRQKQQSKPINYNNSDIENDLRNALMYIQADEYQQWIDVGLSLKNEGEQYRGLWLIWSAGYPGFDMVEASKKWDSFNPDGRMTKASIFKLAMDGGWVNKKSEVKVNGFDNYKPEIQEWNGNLSGDIDYIIPFDCVQRDIQQFILKNSIYPQPALAYVAAMVVVAVCIGRDIAYENIKGNMMFVGLAESGEGKDFPFKIIKSILDAIGLGDSIEGKPASGAAFFEAVAESPSVLFHIDEYGHFLNGLSGKGASVYAKEVVSGLTTSYTSADTMIIGKRTKGVEPIKVNQPNVCLLGMSTEGQIFNGLNSNDVADGSLARYMLVFGVNDLMPKQVVYNNELPKNIIDRLNKLMRKYRQDGFLAARQFKHDDRVFDKVKWDLMCKIKKRGIETKQPMFKPFYNRVLVRAVQGSLLIDQCDNPDVLRWLVDLELQTCEVFVKKFLHLSSDNENEKHAKILQSKIKEAGKRGITGKTLLQKTRQVQPHIRKMMLMEMIESGLVFEENKKIGKSSRESKVYFWVK